MPRNVYGKKVKWIFPLSHELTRRHVEGGPCLQGHSWSACSDPQFYTWITKFNKCSHTITLTSSDIWSSLNPREAQRDRKASHITVGGSNSHQAVKWLLSPRARGHFLRSVVKNETTSERSDGATAGLITYRQTLYSSTWSYIHQNNYTHETWSRARAGEEQLRLTCNQSVSHSPGLFHTDIQSVVSISSVYRVWGGRGLRGETGAAGSRLPEFLRPWTSTPNMHWD